MNEPQRRAIRGEWESAWRQFDRALADLGEEMDQVWDTWALSVEEANGPLRLEFGVTELLLEWEWIRMEDEGDPPHTFFERLRDLRLRMPEVALCERTAHSFCVRVPAPFIKGSERVGLPGAQK